MTTFIRRILAPPVFEGSEDKTRAARLLHTFVIIVLAIQVLFSITMPIFAPATLSRLILTVPFLVPLIVVLILTYRGRTEWASALLVGSVWIALTLMAVEGGGVRTPAFSSYILLVLLTGLLLGTRASLGIAALSIVAGAAMEYAISIGVSPAVPPGSTAMTIWFSQGVELVAAAVILHLAISSVSESLARARQELVERKRAEDALARLGQQNKMILDSAGEGIIGLDSQGIQTFINPAAAAMLRYKPAELIGRDGLSTWHHTKPDGTPQSKEDCTICKALRDGRVYRESGDVFWRKDGTSFPVEYVSTPIHEQGRIAGAVVTFVDITERKQTETALLRREAYLQAIMNNIPYLMWLKDPEGKFLAVNNLFARSCGRDKAEDVVGKTDLDVWPPELANNYRADDAEVMATLKQKKVEEPLADKNTVKWFETFKTPIVDQQGRLIGTTGIAQDITERKLADERLRESEDRFRTFVEHTSEWILMTDEQGTVVEWNHGAEQITGLEREGVVGNPLWDVQFQLVSDEHKSPDMYERLQSTYVEMLRTGASPIMNRAVESRFRRGDGVVRVAEQRLFPISTAKGIRLSGIGRDITERKLAEEQIRQQLERLAALHSIDTAISSSFDLRVTLDILLGQVTTQLGVDAADVLLFDPTTHTLKFAVGRGFRSQALQHTRLRLGEGNAGRVALEHRVIGLPDVTKDAGSFGRSPQFAGEGFMAYYGAPLVVKGQIKGVLEIFHRAALTPDQEWLDFLETLATQAAIAVDNVTLFDNLQHSNVELEMAYDATLEGWSRALDLRDQETEGHSMRVTTLAVELARRMGIHDEELVNIRRGALLHDIGKMGIPDRILLKPAALTDEEWTIMRKHPEYAHKFLSPITYLIPALDVPYCHHEKWNGSGYPRGLKGELIPLAARVFAVVDVWDAVRSDRPYRAAWSTDKALEYIRAQAGRHFDPRVVEAFLNMLSEAPELS